MRNVVVALLCLASVWAVPSVSGGGADAAADAKPATPGRLNARVHRDGDKSLPYQLLIPKEYVAGDAKAWPLIVWLHGSGEKGTDNKAPISRIGGTFLTDGEKARAFVLVPQCPDGMAWHANGLNKQPPVPDSSRLLLLAIADVTKEFKLDDRRISLGGLTSVVRRGVSDATFHHHAVGRRGPRRRRGGRAAAERRRHVGRRADPRGTGPGPAAAAG